MFPKTKYCCSVGYGQWFTKSLIVELHLSWGRWYRLGYKNTLVKQNLVDFWEITGFNLCLSLFIQFLSDSLPANSTIGPYKPVEQHSS